MGFMVGLLIGSTGMGGGAITTPLLILLMGVSPVMAVGTDLLFATVTKITGAVQHARQKTVNFTLVKYLLYGSIPGAIFGALIIRHIDTSTAEGADEIIVLLLSVILITIGFLIMYRNLVLDKGREKFSKHIRWNKNKIRKTILVGFITGMLVSATSVGSGTIIVMFIILSFSIVPSKIVGTDVMHGAMIVGVAAMFKAGVGNVDYLIAFYLIIGSLPGVLIGSRLCMKIKMNVMRTILSIVLIGVGILMLCQYLLN